MKNLGFKPQFILDIGAFVGNWTRMAKNIFPEAHFFMIEPQTDKEVFLKSLAIEYPDFVSYSINLLGSESGSEVTFYEMETGSSVFQERSDVLRHAVKKRLVTLDDLLETIHWNRVDFIKLDVQGYELEVLKGARKTLESVEAILMEVSLMPIYQGGPLLHDAISSMREMGYLAYDICSLLRRPIDLALCQTDIIFVKESSSLLKDKFFWRKNNG